MPRPKRDCHFSHWTSWFGSQGRGGASWWAAVDTDVWAPSSNKRSEALCDFSKLSAVSNTPNCMLILSTQICNSTSHQGPCGDTSFWAWEYPPLLHSRCGWRSACPVTCGGGYGKESQLVDWWARKTISLIWVHHLSHSIPSRLPAIYPFCLLFQRDP